MTLRDTHLESLTSFHKKVLRGFLHLSKRCPIPSIYFLTGELPIIGELHRDIFSLFYSIWCNPQSKIYEIVSYLLENAPENSHTWSRHIRNIAKVYGITDPLEAIKSDPPEKEEYKEYVRTKITVHFERKLRIAANQNSKMLYLNVNIKGLNGRPHVVLDYSTNTKDVQRLHSHLKLLCNDLYTYETKATFHGGSSNCRLCKPDSPPCSNVENVNHIISECQAYSDIRNRILFQMEIVVRKSENKVMVGRPR